MRGKEVLQRIAVTVPFDDHEKHQYERTGYIRWRSILHFYSIDRIKAGYMRRTKGCLAGS